MPIRPRKEPEWFDWVETVPGLVGLVRLGLRVSMRPQEYVRAVRQAVRDLDLGRAKGLAAAARKNAPGLSGHKETRDVARAVLKAAEERRDELAGLWKRGGPETLALQKVCRNMLGAAPAAAQKLGEWVKAGVAGGKGFATQGAGPAKLVYGPRALARVADEARREVVRQARWFGVSVAEASARMEARLGELAGAVSKTRQEVLPVTPGKTGNWRPTGGTFPRWPKDRGPSWKEFQRGLAWMRRDLKPNRSEAQLARFRERLKERGYRLRENLRKALGAENALKHEWARKAWRKTYEDQLAHAAFLERARRILEAAKPGDRVRYSGGALVREAAKHMPPDVRKRVLGTPRSTDLRHAYLSAFRMTWDKNRGKSADFWKFPGGRHKNKSISEVWRQEPHYVVRMMNEGKKYFKDHPVVEALHHFGGGGKERQMLRDYYKETYQRYARGLARRLAGATSPREKLELLGELAAVKGRQGKMLAHVGRADRRELLKLILGEPVGGGQYKGGVRPPGKVRFDTGGEVVKNSRKWAILAEYGRNADVKEAVEKFFTDREVMSPMDLQASGRVMERRGRVGSRWGGLWKTTHYDPYKPDTWEWPWSWTEQDRSGGFGLSNDVWNRADRWAEAAVMWGGGKPQQMRAQLMQGRRGEQRVDPYLPDPAVWDYRKEKERVEGWMRYDIGKVAGMRWRGPGYEELKQLYFEFLRTTTNPVIRREMAKGSGGADTFSWLLDDMMRAARLVKAMMPNPVEDALRAEKAMMMVDRMTQRSFGGSEEFEDLAETPQGWEGLQGSKRGRMSRQPKLSQTTPDFGHDFLTPEAMGFEGAELAGLQNLSVLEQIPHIKSYEHAELLYNRVQEEMGWENVAGVPQGEALRQVLVGRLKALAWTR